MISSQYEIKGGIQGKRFIIRKWILSVSRYNLSVPIWPVVLCPVLQDFSEGSSLFGIKWLLVGDFFSNSFRPRECFLACDISVFLFCASVLIVTQSNLHL